MASHTARQAAYAELVAGLLDIRDEGAQERFNLHVQQLVADGLMTAEVARSVRLLQRQSVQALVEHAQMVLPATLMAVEQSHREQWQHERDQGGDSVDDTDPDDLTDELTGDLTEEMPDDIAEGIVAHDGPVDLTARRLLVAGLTLLPDP